MVRPSERNKAMTINGAAKVAGASERIRQRDYGTWENIYYDFKTETVMMAYDKIRLEDDSEVYKVCRLIRPNTEQEIIDTVKAWLRA